jgi:hypothetical protein
MSNKLFKLKKFGSIVDTIDNLEIRKIYPTLFIKQVALELPAIQRDINSSHVDELVKAILAKPSILNDNRILIGIYDDKFYIVDGQHRIKAIQQIVETPEYSDFIFPNDIWIHFKLCKTFREIEETYSCVNRNFPLEPFQKLIVDNAATSKDLVLYRELKNYMAKTYKKYCSSVEPRVPGINPEHLVAKLSSIRDSSGLTLVDHFKIETLEHFINYIDKINTKISELFNMEITRISQKKKPNMEEKRFLKLKETIEQKAINGKFLYLGLAIDCYKLCFDLEYPVLFSEFQHYNKKEIDQQVWNQYCKDPTIGYINCYCCNRYTISKDSCHMGHVLARRYGGLYTIDNLRPICSTCNIDMGTTELYVYKAKIIDNDVTKETVVNNIE